MLKIFLTGDNHIGLKYASYAHSEVFKEKRISAFNDMVDKANTEKCSMFVIAGDLFENTYSISKSDIKTVLDSLSHFNGTVVLLPGNHDYYEKEKEFWKQFEEKIRSYDNIMLLSEYRPYAIKCNDDDVVLYPALCTSKHSDKGKNNLDWIKKEADFSANTYNIGIAHGAVDGETIDNEQEYFLMKRTELENIPVDLWLIGHTHVPFPKNLKEDEYTAGEKIFNAGTHVQTDVSCNTEGQCFIIELDENKKVKAKKFISGNVRFYRKNINVSADEFENKLNQELSDINDDSYVELEFNGAVSAEEYEKRDEIIKKSLSRFIENSCNTYNLSKVIDEKLIDSEYPETSFSAQLLKSLLSEPKETQLAYEMLRALKEEK